MGLCNNNFMARKKMFMRKLESAKDNGEVDEDIIELLELFNELPFLYTTSSCSGRIMLIDIPKSQRKEESRRLVRWHRPVRFDELWELVRNYMPQGVLWFKQEAFIVAFAVCNMAWASYFIRLARLLGFKESGIRSINLRAGHIIMDITSTEKMHIPIAVAGKGLLISEEYAQDMLNIANKLLLRTKSRLVLLTNVIKEIVKRVRAKEINEPKEIGFKFIDPIMQKFRK